MKKKKPITKIKSDYKKELINLKGKLLRIMDNVTATEYIEQKSNIYTLIDKTLLHIFNSLKEIDCGTCKK